MRCSERPADARPVGSSLDFSPSKDFFFLLRLLLFLDYVLDQTSHKCGSGKVNETQCVHLSVVSFSASALRTRLLVPFCSRH